LVEQRTCWKTRGLKVFAIDEAAKQAASVARDQPDTSTRELDSPALLAKRMRRHSLPSVCPVLLVAFLLLLQAPSALAALEHLFNMFHGGQQQHHHQQQQQQRSGASQFLAYADSGKHSCSYLRF
jgi:hypothetical protein